MFNNYFFNKLLFYLIMDSNLDKGNPSLFASLLQMSIDLLMIFIPSIGYFFQALKFKQTKSSKGFSKSLCLLLLLANILRVFYWIGKKFSLTLLYQSIIVIISQIYLIHYFLKYQDKSIKDIVPEKSILEQMTTWRDILNPSKIWNWDYELDYYKFIIFLFFIFSLICSFVGSQNIKFFEIIGTISVSIETFIEIPQIKENCITKNTKNLSGSMVLMWFLGDLVKTTYNIIYKSPMQMIVGGIIQNCEDIILSSQVIIYGDKGFLSKIFRKHYKYFNLSDNDDKIGDNKGLMNDKIDFDIEHNSKDHMGTLKIGKDENRTKLSMSNKEDEFNDDEDDDINIDTKIVKK